MTTPSPAFAYGVFLGQFQRAMTEFGRALAAGFEAGARPTTTLTLEQRELVAEAAYRRRIAREREIGLRYVRDTATRVRRELGLPR